MYEWLRETLVDRLRLPADAVTAGATLDEAGLDSLAVTELVMIVQEEWGVVVDEDELAACATVDAVAALVEQGRQQHAAR
ncbi:acyl carrier protein [Streptomyces sp. NPDC059247]|uniref:acyl carrier protein n=1 Tax=Streptomyces sp. NPDC059247 TaxID=3346790 RepID=UPI00367E8084